MMFSVVIPAFRGAETLPALYQLIDATFGRLQYSFEVVIIFDGGQPETWQSIKALALSHPSQVRGIRLSRNFGQHNATICGFKHAKGDFIFTMDEDLQHHPDDFHLLIQKQVEGDYDLVYGYYMNRRHSWFRNITSNLLGYLLRVSIPDLNRYYSSFRLIKAGIARQTLEMTNSYTFLDGYLTWITHHTGSVPITHYPSEAKTSAYSLGKLIEHSVNIFITFSNLPIRIMTWTSGILTLFSLIYGSYVLIRKLVYDDFVSGFATFAVFGSFALAILLFSLGIIGEYVSRINFKTSRRPNFNEAEIV